ncbi:MAG: hypothetical protein WCV73_03730 [Patescibacteria group bacterium]|jgi:hypothetical protein
MAKAIRIAQIIGNTEHGSIIELPITLTGKISQLEVCSKGVATENHNGLVQFWNWEGRQWRSFENDVEGEGILSRGWFLTPDDKLIRLFEDADMPHLSWSDLSRRDCNVAIIQLSADWFCTAEGVINKREKEFFLTNWQGVETPLPLEIPLQHLRPAKYVHKILEGSSGIRLRSILNWDGVVSQALATTPGQKIRPTEIGQIRFLRLFVKGHKSSKSNPTPRFGYFYETTEWGVVYKEESELLLWPWPKSGIAPIRVSTPKGCCHFVASPWGIFYLNYEDLKVRLIVCKK